MDLSGELARTLLELAPDPTVVVDTEGRIVFANAQIEHAFGYAPSELIGQPVEILLPERFRAAHPEHRRRFAENPKPRPMGASLSLYGLHKNGLEFPVEISLSPILTENGPIVVGAIRDATVRKHTENQLVEANRAKSRFLAAASHDLRQPLQTLNLLNRVALRQAGDNAPLRSTLERQQRALDTMSALLASVLDISKLDSGAVEPKPVVCPLADVFEKLRSDYEPQAHDKGLDLIVEDASEATFADPELLRRLLGNLLSNAIRYTETGHVRLRCTREGDEVRLEVTDTGIGIAKDDLDRIFEEFYQVDHGTQRPEGLGLGLSIVRRIATLMGCRIEVQSAPGKGTTFAVMAPRAELPATQQSAPTESPTAAHGTILIVDDEPAVAEATSLLLELEGFDVFVATCQQEALARAADRRPDLIVSDFHLRGGETGIGVVEAVRGHLQAPIPAVFVTGDTGRSAVAQATLDNAKLLSKPIRADDLLAVIRERLSASNTAAS